MSTIPLGFRRNENGFAVWPVHYSMDPAKATPEWKESEQSGMPRWMWRKEYEMDPYASSGAPAFPDISKWQQYIYRPLSDVVPDGIIPEWWPRYAGFDWGRRNPSAVLFCTVRPDGVIIFYWEMYQKNLEPQQIHAKVSLHPDWPKVLKGFVGCDPSMFSMTPRGGGLRGSDKSEDEKALADMFILFGWPMVPGMRGDDITFIQELYKAWSNLDRPRIIITHSCPNFWWELNHLRHDELNTKQINKKNLPEKLVAKDNHAFHAAKYLLRLNPSRPNIDDEWEYLDSEQRAQIKRPPKEEYMDDPYLGALA